MVVVNRVYPVLSVLALCLLSVIVGCGGGGGESDAAATGGPDAAAEDQGPPLWIRQAVEQPRGLLRNEAGALPGYVLFTQFTSDLSYLVNLEGEVVHTWSTAKAGAALYLKDNGNMLRLARIPEPPNFRAGGVSGYIQELSWDGDLVWEWKMGDEERMLHHDIEPLPNGNILAIGWELITAEKAAAAGRRADLVPEQGLWSEWILEVEPLPPNDARIVWEWHVWDHLVQNTDADAPNFGELSDYPRRLDVNADADTAVVDEEELEQLKALGYVPDNATTEDIQSDFLHMNAIEYHAGLDQIAVSNPEIGEIWILDHSTTTEEARGSTGGRRGHGGDFLYRWGNPKTYGRGDDSDQKIFYQHNILWLPEGVDNAGNLTLFNNGSGRADGDWSSVMEWTPPLEDDGNYTLAEGAAFGPTEPVWTYAAADRGSFYAPFVSGAHRLENGNTFICSGPQGRYFEVTPAGAIVWEYRNPFHGEVEGWQPEGTEQFAYASFRAMKIMPDHPALEGRELAPLDPQPPVFVAPQGPPPGAEASSGS